MAMKGLLDLSSFFVLQRGDGARSAHHAACAQVSEQYVCCFMLFSLLPCRFVSGRCPHTPVWRCQVFFAVNFGFCFFNSIHCCSFISFQFLFSAFCTSTQCCRPYKLVESGLPTYCPYQLKTGPVSPRHSYNRVPCFESLLSSCLLHYSQRFVCCRSVQYLVQ